MPVSGRQRLEITQEDPCTNPLCGADPEIHPNSAKMLARTSIARMAPTSCQDGQVPVPRVTKINQFCYDQISAYPPITRELLYDTLSGKTYFRKSNLKEKNLLNASPILNNTSVVQK